jgi:hypothetical protein
MKIVQGQVIAFFAFDIGYEVSLEKLGALLASVPVQPLSRKKQTPNYLQYTTPPRVLDLGPIDGALDRSGQIQATVFDFGAISLSYRWPLAARGCEASLEKMAAFSQRLYNANLEAHAREQVRTLIDKLRPAITRPDLSELVEDYFLFVFEQLAEPLSAAELISRYRATLAQILRFDTLPLSPDQQDEALSQTISYYENDLTIVDWNAAIIYDPDYQDTANVLELLNVELLEARYVDAQLDKRIGEYTGLVQRRPEWALPLRTPYRRAIQELAELRTESSLLSERVDNALKLIGDLYLARVHNAAAKRFYLHEWDTAIARKLNIVSDYYQLLTDRVRTAQSHTLELIIIALILAEILMAIFGGHK